MHIVRMVHREMPEMGYERSILSHFRGAYSCSSAAKPAEPSNGHAGPQYYAGGLSPGNDPPWDKI